MIRSSEWVLLTKSSFAEFIWPQGVVKTSFKAAQPFACVRLQWVAGILTQDIPEFTDLQDNPPPLVLQLTPAEHFPAPWHIQGCFQEQIINISSYRLNTTWFAKRSLFPWSAKCSWMQDVFLLKQEDPWATHPAFCPYSLQKHWSTAKKSLQELS